MYLYNFIQTNDAEKINAEIVVCKFKIQKIIS